MVFGSSRSTAPVVGGSGREGPQWAGGLTGADLPADAHQPNPADMLAFLAVWAAASLHLVGASQLRSATATSEAVAVAEVTASGGFVYDYAKHGEDWVMGQCASRARQSPIDLSFVESPSSSKFSISYNTLTEPFELINNGHSFSADLRGLGLGGVSRDNVYYEIMYMNIHAMAEHTLDGVRKPAEIHLVHKRYDSDALLVIAVPLDCASPPPVGGTPLPPLGAAYSEPPMTDYNYNQVIQGLLRVRPPPINFKVGMPGGKGPAAMDLANFVAGAPYMEYPGSTTAPPCAETTIWLVRSKPVMASDAQIRYLHDAIYQSTANFGNYRNAMPVSGRSITIRHPVIEDPPVMKSEQPVVPVAAVPAISREFRSLKWAKDALRVARDSMDYVRDLDSRIHAAADAQANGLAPTAMPALNPMFLPGMMMGPAPGPMPAPMPAPCPGAVAAEQAIAMANTIRETAHLAVSEATAQVAAQAKMEASMAAQNAAEMVIKELRLKNPMMVPGR
jgi:carbonic anhydrase